MATGIQLTTLHGNCIYCKGTFIWDDGEIKCRSCGRPPQGPHARHVFYEANKSQLSLDLMSLSQEDITYKWDIDDKETSRLRTRWGLKRIPVPRRDRMPGPPPTPPALPTLRPAAAVTAVAKTVVPVPATPHSRAVLPCQHQAAGNNGLIYFPAFNDAWPPLVQRAWLSCYVQLVNGPPPKEVKSV